MDHLCREVAHRFVEGYVQHFQTEAHRSTARSEQSENTEHKTVKICATGPITTADMTLELLVFPAVQSCLPGFLISCRLKLDGG